MQLGVWRLSPWSQGDTAKRDPSGQRLGRWSQLARWGRAEQRWSSWAQGAWNQLPRAVSTGALHVAPGAHRDTGLPTYLPVVHGKKTIWHLNTSQTQALTRGLVTCVPCKLATARPHSGGLTLMGPHTQRGRHSEGQTLRRPHTQRARHSDGHTLRGPHSEGQTLKQPDTQRGPLLVTSLLLPSWNSQ